METSKLVIHNKNKVYIVDKSVIYKSETNYIQL